MSYTTRREMNRIMKTCFLPDRAVIAIGGADSITEAEDFLQGLLTQDVSTLAAGSLFYSGLLTPQGKLIADFFVSFDGENYLIACNEDIAKTLLQRLMLYRLRAKVTLEDVSDRIKIAAAWDGDDGIWPQDPRLATLGFIGIGNKEKLKQEMENWQTAKPDDYSQWLYENGIPMMGRDFSTEQVFPTDINMDALNGVSYKKGCFVGQEVASRMKRKGSMRKRTYGIKGDNLPATGSVKAGTATIGEILSSNGTVGLCLTRLDRLEKAGDADLSCENNPVTLLPPSYLKE
jgi:tRNA-modifying protein YgfZ